MQVLLDFHYSDSWADGGSSHSAGLPTFAMTQAGDTLYQYTYYILTTLTARSMPEMVQVGNRSIEMLQSRPAPTNGDIRQATDKLDAHALLINAGIKAVRDAGRTSATKPRIMLQTPSRECGALFADATAGVTDFDLIGISYYGYQWSKYGMAQTGDAIAGCAPPIKTNVDAGRAAYPWGIDCRDAQQSQQQGRDAGLSPQHGRAEEAFDRSDKDSPCWRR